MGPRMDIEIQLTREPVAETIAPPATGLAGAWVEFRGLVRGEEHGGPIEALRYEAYPEMAEREIRRLLVLLAAQHPCLAAKVIHRLGVVPVGATAIYVGIAATHRGEAFALLTAFMDHLKQEVPIWKQTAAGLAPATEPGPVASQTPPAIPATISQADFETAHFAAGPSLDEAIAVIYGHCQPLPTVTVPLEAAFGRVLHEMACAPKDLPSCDRSTRDGYAVLEFDLAEVFRVVDTIQSADSKPRQLRPGEAVRVSTGAALPCAGLRVVTLENVERSSHSLRIMRHEAARNLRHRGEDVKAGELLVAPGERLDAGKLALLAAAGCTHALVSPRLRVVHVTTGPEVPSPGLLPGTDPLRDRDVILIRSLLQHWSCDVFHLHLPENLARARAALAEHGEKIEPAEVLVVSGGTSPGEINFMRALLTELGYECLFSQVNVRPGRRLLFGVDGRRVAFGLAGNPLEHFVGFHLGVATALARLAGEEPPIFSRGRLAMPLPQTATPHETLWPAKHALSGGEMRLHPLPWTKAGDAASFAEANALIRVPAQAAPLTTGMLVDFLPANH